MSGINPVTIKNIRIATTQCERLPLHSLPGTYSLLMVLTLSISEFLKTFWARSAVQLRKVCALIWTYEWLKYANSSGGLFTSRSFTDQLSLKLQFFLGFLCESKSSFQCDNGHCVSKDLVCDGDTACVDNSDEKNCKCLTSDFACPSGECLDVEKLCDLRKDCKDGTDEARCGKQQIQKS